MSIQRALPFMLGEDMKASDTVMTPKEIGKRWNIHQPTLVHGGLINPLLLAQAEISFKAGIREVVEPSDELLEIGRKAIEDVLIEWRDSRLSEFTRGNGLVIREKDGRNSTIIRFGPETALKIGLKAMRQAKLKEWGIQSATLP